MIIVLKKKMPIFSTYLFQIKWIIKKPTYYYLT